MIRRLVVGMALDPILWFAAVGLFLIWFGNLPPELP